MSNVAVIMSVYRLDSVETLTIAIDSILGQSYDGCDLFLYCDGPLPYDLDRCVEWYNDNYVNIFLFRGEENRGLALSLNSLIEEVLKLNMYGFIARMDSDDISRQDRIRVQIEFLKNNPDIDVCGTSCREFGATFSLEEKHLPETHAELLDFSITRCPFIHPSVMFRVSVFQSSIRYPIDTDLTEDMALWFELLHKGYKFSNINEILLDYRLNDNTMKRRHGIGKAATEIKIRFRYMFLLKRISVKNLSLIFARLVFHLLPPVLMRFVYRKVR